MESLKETLFEDPFYLYVVLAFAALAMAGMWYGQRKTRWLVLAAACVGLGVGAFFLERWVETDREQILRAVGEIARDVEAGRFDKMDEYLDEKFGGSYADKAGAIAAGRLALQTADVKSIKVVRYQLDLKADPVEFTVTTSIVYIVQGQMGRNSITWKTQWAKRAPGWRITHVNRQWNEAP